MKFCKSITCENCQLKCAIYSILVKTGKDLKMMEPLHAYFKKHDRGGIAENLIYLSNLNNKHIFNLGLSRKELGEMVAISERSRLV